MNTFLFFFPYLAFRRQAIPLLRQELGDQAGDAAWADIRAQRKQLKASRPRHSPGVNLLIRYMELDVAFYRSVMAAGVTQARAGELVQALNWQVFKPGITVSFAISRLRSNRAIVRCRWMLNAMFTLLFTAPFKRTMLPREDDRIAFDITACPLAAYFRSQGVPELTRHAACSLDHEMAKIWGVEFRRTKTIAEGAPLCDFRYTLQRDTPA